MLRSLTVAARMMFFNGLLALVVGSTAVGQDPSSELSARAHLRLDDGDFTTIDDERIRRIVEEVLEDRSNANSVVETGDELTSSWSPGETVSERLTVKLGNGGTLKLYGYGRGDLYWFVSWEAVAVPIAGEDNFISRGVGIDWSLPLDDRITWRGEAWYGRDLSDWRGGIAQGVNTATGEEIESRGGWTELQFEPFEWWRFAVGATVDDPVDNDLIGNTTQRTLNWTWYLGNRFPLGGGLNVAVNLEFWNTEYLALDKGDAMRFKTWVIQRF